MGNKFFKRKVSFDKKEDFFGFLPDVEDTFTIFFKFYFDANFTYKTVFKKCTYEGDPFEKYLLKPVESELIEVDLEQYLKS